MSTFDMTLGSCLDATVGLASLGSKSVDHTITDPPYEAEAHTQQARQTKGGAAKVAKAPPLPFAAITDIERYAIAHEIGRITRRWAIVFCQIEAAVKWRDALIAGGMVARRIGIWIKPDGAPQFSGDRPGMGYETIVFCHAPGASRWNGGGRHGVYQATRAKGTVHPTQKPVGLMEALIRDFTDAGEMIADPYAGSGTTGLAALRHGRSFMGWEIDPNYCAAAVKRLLQTREQLTMDTMLGGGNERDGRS